LDTRSTSEAPVAAGVDPRTPNVPLAEVAPVTHPQIRVAWLPGLRPYGATWDLQRKIHAERLASLRPDTLLLLEHEPVVTIGRNAGDEGLLVSATGLRARGIDLVRTDRGGDITYHGPGQLIGYPIVDLKGLHNDVHRFLREIEEGIIRAVARWGIVAGRNPGKTGVWVGDQKLASIGLKASHWVTMHGFALNVTTDLTPFDLIVPCGIAGCRMVSMHSLTGKDPSVRRVGEAVTEELCSLWGRAPAIEERD
jgi:lipoate-protein ligase B